MLSGDMHRIVQHLSGGAQHRREASRAPTLENADQLFRGEVALAGTDLRGPHTKRRAGRPDIVCARIPAAKKRV